MTTLEVAWEAFQAAVAEAQELHASGAGAEVLQDPLRRARELLTVIDAEPAADLLHLPPDVRDGLEQLRTELAQLQSGPAATHSVAPDYVGK